MCRVSGTADQVSWLAARDFTRAREGTHGDAAPAGGADCLKVDGPDVDRLETLGLLTAGLAHEIASPLQAIIHNLRYVEDGLAAVTRVCDTATALAEAPDAQTLAAFRAALHHGQASHPVEELQAALADSVEATHRAAAMVHAIADFAQAGGREEVFDLHPVLLSVMTLTRNAWKYIAEVDTVFQPDPPQVRGSTRAVSLGCVRLILAAARSLAEREGGRAVEAGRILVETVQRDDQIEVLVTAGTHVGILQVPVAER